MFEFIGCRDPSWASPDSLSYAAGRILSDTRCIGRMARKTKSRKDLRAEAEAVEALEKAGKKKKAKKKAKRKSRKKADAEVRMKLFWGVFNQSMKRVALYDFSQQKEAEKKATELSKKSPHFVQKVKEVIEE